MEMLKKEEVICLFSEILKKSTYGCAENFIEIENKFKNTQGMVMYYKDKFYRHWPIAIKGEFLVFINYDKKMLEIAGRSERYNNMFAFISFDELIKYERKYKLAEILS